MLRTIKFIAILISVFAVSGQAGLAPLRPPTEYFGRVTRVLDGDRIVVNFQGRKRQVLVYGVDCPSTGIWGRQAREFTHDLAARRGVYVRVKRADRRGRSIGQINFIGGRDLGEELVKNGFARWSRKTAPKEKQLAILESQARARRVGLWAKS